MCYLLIYNYKAYFILFFKYNLKVDNICVFDIFILVHRYLLNI
jgi:hypothetical protein